MERTTTTERYPGLTLATIPGRYYLDQLAGSALARVDATALPADNPFAFPAPADGLADRLTGGDDGSAPLEADYLRLRRRTWPKEWAARPGGRRRGRAAGRARRHRAPPSRRALVEQASRLMDRFAVLDPVGTTTPATLTEIQNHAKQLRHPVRGDLLPPGDRQPTR